ncbi:MAG: hypothetical protein IJD43_06990 [Thermoguttaceae bacterium]|nr:hypothetical protein [Thermoguttaceae bacterium]
MKKKILNRLDGYKVYPRFIRVIPEQHDPLCFKLREACYDKEGRGCYRDCFALYAILAREALQHDSGCLTIWEIQRFAWLDYEPTEVEICLETLVRCGFVFEIEDRETGLKRYAFLDEQCSRLSRNYADAMNRIKNGKSRASKMGDHEKFALYDKAQKSLMPGDVLEYGVDGAIARFLNTEQGQPEAEVITGDGAECVPPEQPETVPAETEEDETETEPEEIETEETEIDREKQERESERKAEQLRYLENAMQGNQKETEQPETSPQGENCAGESRGYWNDCMT